jgi:polysaccharide deacetylase family protein (PEP-CTERM system associated)
MLNAFTVDVEDYYQVQAFADRVDPRRWDDYESRVVVNTRKILRILDERQVRGTFFILGWVAERYPELVREIQRAGHEIGSHGYWHRLVYETTPDEFRRDLVRARDAIEQVVGEPVTSYRAPSFSITRKSLWSLDVLIEQGFQYDSSIFPVHHDKYGIPDAKRFPHVIRRNGSSLLEFPPSVYRLGKLNFPVAGGGYFRLYPAWLSLRLLGRINRGESQPFVFYIHPWELDPDQPRLRGSLKSRFRHYQNLGRTEAKLRRLLGAFSFGRLSEVLHGSVSAGAEEAPA